MKLRSSVVFVAVIASVLMSLLSGAAGTTVPAARAQDPVDPGDTAAAVPAVPGVQAGGMPGWGLPAKPIPHHEPGRPSRAGSYTTEVTGVDGSGAPQAVEITGVAALAADGADPLAGNYSLVDLDQIMLTWNDNGLKLRTYTSTITTTLRLIGDTDIENYLSSDIAAGDLNGDGRDEQIVSWRDPADGHIWMSIGEMPDSPGRTTSAPAAASTGDGKVDVVVRGYDDALWRRRYEGGAWGPWDNSGGGTLASGPAIASQGDDQFDVYAIDANNQVRRNHWNGTFGPWQEIGGWDFPLPDWAPGVPDVAAPAVAVFADYADLFRLGPDNTVHWNHSEDGGATWSGWRNLFGMISTGLSAVVTGPNQVQVFGRGVDDAIWSVACTGGACAGWQRLEIAGWPTGVAMASAPVVVRTGVDQFTIYSRGSDGKPYSASYAGGSGSWNAGGGELASGLGVARLGDAYELFAQRYDGRLQQSNDGQLWTPWDALPSCCARYDTGLVATEARVADYRDNTLEVDTGYFFGDGRSQIALAYRKSSTQTGVALFGIQGGFRAQLVSHAVLDNAVDASITTGDFLGQDGLDDVAVAYIFNHAGGVKHGVKLLTFPPNAAPLVALGHEENDTEPCTDSMMRSSGTVEATSGDYDGDGQEEIATIAVFDCAAREHSCDTYLYRTRTRIYDVLGTPPQQRLEYYWHEESWQQEAKREAHPWSVSLSIASGDVDGDGKDEIVRTWPLTFDDEYETCYSLFDWYENSHLFIRQLQVMNLPDNDLKAVSGWDTTSPADHRIDGSSVTGLQNNGPTGNSYLDRVAVGDLDRNLVDEPVWHMGIGGGRKLAVFESDGSGGYTNPHSLTLPHNLYPNLTTGTFSGESLRVGKPTYRLQNRVDSLVAVINMPPKHQDYVQVCNPTCHYELIEVLVEACFTGSEPGCTHAKHATSSGAQSSTETTNKRDWMVGAGLATRVEIGGAFAEASLDATYGQNFSRSDGLIRSSSFTEQAVASSSDQIVYFGTPYETWEYPIFASDSLEAVDYMTVVFPQPAIVLGEQRTRDADYIQGDWPEAPWYRAGHQTYNVWSYDARADPVRFPDYDPSRVFMAKDYSTSNVGFSFKNEHTGTFATTNNKSHAISSQIGGGYETPKLGGAVGFSASVNAYVKGSYNQENLTTEAQTTTDATDISGWFGQMSRPFASRVIGYYARDGYMVLDYQTDMPAPAWNSIYSSPDPAFILPWAGFAYGTHPVLPTPGLELFSPEVLVEPSFAGVGQSVTISATVRNFSNIEASNVKVRFCRGDPACTPGDTDSFIGERDTGLLNRITRGPVTVSIPWQAAGSGEQKIYAILDPLNQITPEVHDEDDLINNNVAFGLVRIGALALVDQGRASAVPYESFRYDQATGATIAAYVPPGNLPEVVHFALQDAGVAIPGAGKPFALVPYKGVDFRGQSPYGMSLKPDSRPPAVISLVQPGANLDNMKLYRALQQTATAWEEATCPGYRIQRFSAQSTIMVPVCHTGIFVFSSTPPPGTQLPQKVYLPLIRR